MPNGTQPDDAVRCDEVQMTPVQCNVVIENKLENLQPMLELTLTELTRLRDGLANGEIHWGDLLKRAIKKHEAASQ